MILRKCGSLALIRICRYCPGTRVSSLVLIVRSGGGNLQNLEADLFGPSLRWMLDEAQTWGLRLGNIQGKWREIKSVPSMTFVWRLFELFPWKRLKYDPESDPEDTGSW